MGVELRVGAVSEAARARRVRASVGVATSADVTIGDVAITAAGVFRLRFCRIDGAEGLSEAVTVADEVGAEEARAEETGAGVGAGVLLRLLDKRTYDMAEMAERGSSASASVSAMEPAGKGPGPGTVGPGENGCRFDLTGSGETVLVTEGVLLVGERIARRFFWVLGTNRPVHRQPQCIPKSTYGNIQKHKRKINHNSISQSDADIELPTQNGQET